jgi:hypothetical protein
MVTLVGLTHLLTMVWVKMEKKIAGGRFTLEDPERKRKMEEDGGDAAEVQRKKVKS